MVRWAMPTLRPRPTPLLAELVVQPPLDHPAVDFLRERGFEPQMAFVGRSAEGQMADEHDRLHKRRIHERQRYHAFWMHPMGLLAQVDCFRMNGQWLLNECSLHGMERVSNGAVFSGAPDTKAYQQADGSTVLVWQAQDQTGSLHLMERVWGWAHQAKERDALLGFSEWEGVQGGRVVPLRLHALLMDWSDVPMKETVSSPLARDALAALRVVKATSSLERELSRHVAGATMGPSLAFWQRVFREGLNTPLWQLEESGALPARLPPTVRAILNQGQGVFAHESRTLQLFHRALGRTFGVLPLPASFSQAEHERLKQWFSWTQLPSQQLFRDGVPPDLYGKVQGADFLDLLCGLPFDASTHAKAKGLLDAMPQDVLERRLSAEDALGMNLTLRLVGLGCCAPLDGKEDEIEAALDIPVGFALLNELAERVQPQHFSLETSQWSAGALLLRIGGVSDLEHQQAGFHRHFLEWVARLGLEFSGEIVFPHASGVLREPLMGLCLARLKELVATARSVGHPDFAIDCQPEDITALKGLVNPLRARSLENALPAAKAPLAHHRF